MSRGPVISFHLSLSTSGVIVSSAPRCSAPAVGVAAPFGSGDVDRGEDGGDAGGEGGGTEVGVEGGASGEVGGATTGVGGGTAGGEDGGAAGGEGGWYVDGQ